MIDRLYDLIVIAKMLKDSKPIIHLYQMLASLFLNVGYKREAYILFETAKDLAHEAQNLAQEMICFEYMARTKQYQYEFGLARLAFKKVLQLAWITKIPQYEIKAYNNIAQQYYYMQNIDKSHGFQMKSLMGDIEVA